jgi:hypothetical protein
MSALASRERSPWWWGRRLAGLLLMVVSLAVLCALVAVELAGDKPAPPHSLLALIRLAPHFAAFLGGAALLINTDAISKAPPETLPTILRPRFRRRLAYVLFAVGALDVLSYLFH